MEIKLAKTFGFCWGVRRALSIAEETANAVNGPVQTYGPLIHNEAELERLERTGIHAVDDARQLKELLPVVIRAHGISPEDQRALTERNSNMIDATCPLVKKVHGIVKLKAQRGYRIIIFGEKEHPEIKGVLGYAAGRGVVVRDLQEAKALPRQEGALAMVGQTTEIPGDYERVASFLKSVYPALEVFDTICQPTKDAKNSAVELAKECDLMLVVGGKSSSNTMKLAKLCSSICPTVHISSAADITRDLLGHAERVGITAGASTPDRLVYEVARAVGALAN